MKRRMEIELDEHALECLAKLCIREETTLNQWIVDAINQKMLNARKMIRLQFGDEEATKYE